MKAALSSAFTRKDFLWKKDKNEWHERRADEIRRLHGDKIKQLEGNDPASLAFFFVQSISHWLVAVTFARCIGDNYWLIALCGWWLGGFWAVAAGLAMHEASH